MRGVFQPIINPAAWSANLYQQMLAMVINADNQSARLQEEYMELLHDLKSGAVSLDLVTLGENGGFEVLPPPPPDEEVIVPPIVGKNGRKAKESVPVYSGPC
jgi:hypothetical protein